jgi:sigma-B regulation protein RsbU (phosphoserine phosphatase)
MMFAGISRFFRLQAVYLGVSAIGTAVFWAIGQQINPVTVLVYSLCIGNLTTPPMNRVRRFCGQHPFRFDWLIPVAALTALIPAVFIISSVVVWLLAPPSPQSLEHLLRTGWKFPCLIIFVFAIISWLFTQTKERLEVRNAELQRSVDLSAAQLERQEQDLQRAREIQESLLPKDVPQLRGFQIAASWSPARGVGGDYFDVLRLSDSRLAICIADVVGKGVSAALLMASVQAMVRAFARDSESPAWMCTRVNGVLCGNIAADKFVTFFYAILDAKNHTFDYCSAGHPAPLFVSPNSSSRLQGGGAVLGVFPTWKYEDYTVNLGPGDRLLLFTDGITEAADPQGNEFGEDTLSAFAKSHCAHSAADLNRMVLAQVSDFCAGKFQDDATLLVIAVIQT